MSPPRNEAPLVATLRQRRALATPLRMEIMEAFGVLRTASIAEVARRIGRRPDSLYYHVRTLASVGLLHEAGVRRSGKRNEALYRPVAERIALPLGDGTTRRGHSSSRETLNAVASLLRLSVRETLAGLEAQAQRGPDAGAPTSPSVYVRRMPMPRDAATLAHVARLLAKIEEVVTRAHRNHADDGRSPRCAVTLLLAPIPGREESAPASDASPSGQSGPRGQLQRRSRPATRRKAP